MYICTINTQTFPSLVVTPHEAIVLKKPKQEYGKRVLEAINYMYVTPTLVLF